MCVLFIHLLRVSMYHRRFIWAYYIIFLNQITPGGNTIKTNKILNTVGVLTPAAHVHFLSWPGMTVC